MNMLHVICLLATIGAVHGNSPDYPVDPTGRLTPDSLASSCERKIHHIMDSWASDYNFSSEQADLIRARLYELKQQQIHYSLETAAERWRMSEEARPLYPIVATQPVDSPLRARFDAMRARIQEINRGNVLFHDETLMPEIEQYLTPEQISRARRIREVRRAEEEERRLASARMRMARRKGAELAIDKDGWERFVRQFCGILQLSEAQQATAMSVLRENVQQRECYLQAHWDAWELDLRGDYTGQESPIEAVQKIWLNMMTQLDGIPTQDQFQKATATKAQRTGRPVDVTRPTELVIGGMYSFNLRERRQSTSTQPGTSPIEPATTQPATVSQ